MINWLSFVICYLLISGTSSFVIIIDVDENIPVVDESVIEDVLQASQSQPSSLCKTFLSLLAQYVRSTYFMALKYSFHQLLISSWTN